MHEKPRRVALSRAAAFAGDPLRYDDVLESAELRQEMMRLVDEADRVAPDARALLIGQCRGRQPIDDNFAARRCLEQTRHVEE